MSSSTRSNTVTESMKRRIIASLGSKDAEPYNRALDAIAAMDAKIVNLQAKLEHTRQIVSEMEQQRDWYQNQCSVYETQLAAQAKLIDLEPTTQPLSPFEREIYRSPTERDADVS